MVPPQVEGLELAHSGLLIGYVLLQALQPRDPDFAAQPTADEWAAVSVDDVALDVDE